MIKKHKLVPLLLVASLLAPASLVRAQWDLDANRSSINFVSIKNLSVAEVHSFTSLVGFIGADGAVDLAIDLDSVETLIPIRNERMRKLLFDTVEFPAATIRAAVDPAIIDLAARGGVVTTDLSATLSLHGKDLALTVPVVVIGAGEGQLQAFTPRPVLLDAADFELGAGVSALQNIAGLQSISTAVPVTIHLVFSFAGTIPAGGSP